MIYKQPSPQCDHVRVTFELPSCIWADRIYVTGDFNDWSHTSTPMRQSRDGVWRAVVDLPSGRPYEFRYLIDGRWHTDYHADGSHTNIYGSENSVIHADLPKPKPTLDAAAGQQLHEALPTGAPIHLAMPRRQRVQAAA